MAEIIPADRRIQWNPGIPLGIPNRTTIGSTVNAAAFGNGTTDATNAIATAIDTCPAGQVVFIPAGNYRITNVIVVRRGDVTIRGEGPDKTKIVQAASGNEVFRLGQWADEPSPIADITGVCSIGSTSITVNSASGFSAGDLVRIDQLNTGNPLVGMADECPWWERTNRSVGETNEVAAVNGTTLTFSSPLKWTFEIQYSPQVCKLRNQEHPNVVIHHLGVEDLYVANGDGNNISMINLMYTWIENVESDLVAGVHIEFNSCYRCVVRDCYIHHAHIYAQGGNAYGVCLNGHASDNLIENNIVRYLNIPIVMRLSGGGNVIGYNYIESALQATDLDWNTGDIRTHCKLPHMELIEGNWCAQIAVDNIFGPSSKLTLFRNYVSGKHETMFEPDSSGRETNKAFSPEGNTVAIDLEQYSYDINVVGNVLWRPNQQPMRYEATGVYGECEGVFRLGAFVPDEDSGNGPCGRYDAQVKNTLYRHGNFDYVTGSVIWDSGNSDHSLPKSLYLKEKPAFFGNCAWPYVTPDEETKIASLPAKNRYEGKNPCPTSIISGREKLVQSERFTILSNLPSRRLVFEYSLTNTSLVQLSIFNMLGQKIRTLYRGRQTAGGHTVAWCLPGSMPGIYFCRLTINNEIVMKKFMVR